jgi:uridine kinase
MSTRTAIAPTIIGIAGGSGSGKTTVTRKLAQALGRDCRVIDHDSYYRDRSDTPLEEREAINYDHPDALESELLASHLAELRNGVAIEVPVYDFVSHTRSQTTRRIDPAPVILVEGILVLADADLRAQLDIKIFVDTDPDIRLLRRIGRDMQERGRSFHAVCEQYQRTVRPMHLQFVEPSKRWADLIVPEGGDNRVAIDVLIGKLRALAG